MENNALKSWDHLGWKNPLRLSLTIKLWEGRKHAFLWYLIIFCIIIYYLITSALNLSRIQKIPRLLVGAADGYLYMYNLDPQEGGECTLMKQHK